MKPLENFDQTIDQGLQDGRIPGAAVAMVKGYKILHIHQGMV